MRQWRLVFFTDESRFTLFRPDGRPHVYRHRGERFADACVLERDRFGGGSAMVWGGISHGLVAIVARVCQDFLANHNINPLNWPPYSPDLSPIEHLWGETDRRVRGHRNAPATLDQLRAALLKEWDNIPMRRINALMNLMHRKIRAVTDALGGHTRY
jgi:hypothetical protein